jgi:hypothetical protein
VIGVQIPTPALIVLVIGKCEKRHSFVILIKAGIYNYLREKYIFLDLLMKLGGIYALEGREN